MKDLLLRVYQDGSVRIAFSDGFSIEELQKLSEYLSQVAITKKGLDPKYK